MKIKFTDKIIKKLNPACRSIEYFDKEREFGTGAFGIRISPKGKKTWFIMYFTTTCKVKRKSIGTYPQMSLDQARLVINKVKETETKIEYSLKGYNKNLTKLLMNIPVDVIEKCYLYMLLAVND